MKSLKYRVRKLLMGKNILPAYWYNHKNFGDQLTKELLKYFGFNPIYASPETATFVGVGSHIVTHISRRYHDS
jgi:hypothetical protein